MDDDLEDEVFYQSLLSHMKILSKFMLGLPVNGATFTYLARCVRLFLCKPETIFCALCLLALFAFYDSLGIWLKSALGRVSGSSASGSSGSSSSEARKKLGLGPFSVVGAGFGACGGRNQNVYSKLQADDVGVYALRGSRVSMEDRYSVAANVGDSGVSIYGVFDGHGGEMAAVFAEENLFKSITAKISDSKKSESVPISYSQLLTEEILSLDKQLIAAAKQAGDVSGTTAIVALWHEHKLVVANVGDSRGVICDGKGSAIPLSFDHKPQQLKERKRIEQSGGFVAFNGVWRVGGILATSRALGDYPLKDRKLIIADPDVLTFDINDLKAQFLILASDGLWDTFSNEEAVNFVKDKLDQPYFGARSLAAAACNRSSADNITVLVVNLKSGRVAAAADSQNSQGKS